MSLVKYFALFCIQAFVVQLIFSPGSYGKVSPSNDTDATGTTNSSKAGRKSTVGKALADLIKAIFKLVKTEIKSAEDLIPDFEDESDRDPMSLPLITIENVNGTLVATSMDVNIYDAIRDQQKRHNDSREEHFVSGQQSESNSIEATDLGHGSMDSGENDL